MRWAAVVAIALGLAAPAAAGTSVKVPASKVGQVRVELVTIKGAKAPTLKAANLSALGRGFGAAAVVVRSTKSPGTYYAYLVMFMGNRSTSPASTVNLQVSSGAPAGKPVDESGSCKVLKSIYDDNYGGLGQAAGAFYDIFGFGHTGEDSDSYWEKFAHSTTSYQLQQKGC